MSTRKPSRKVLRSLTSEVHPDDGVDPRQPISKGGLRKVDGHRPGPGSVSNRRKTWQLCGQVADTVGLVLAGEADTILHSLYVVRVEPAPDDSRLLVTVGALPADAEQLDPVEVISHLEHASGHLRSEVATAVTRKRVPALAFRYALITGPDGREAGHPEEDET